MGACTAQANNRMIDMLPIRVLTPELSKDFDVTVEEDFFEGKPAIKVTVINSDRISVSSYTVYYFDKTSLLKIAETHISKVSYIDREGKEHVVPSITTYYNIKINQEIASSEFEIPAGAKICEQNLKAGMDADNKRIAILDNAAKQNRPLTEEEFNQKKIYEELAAKAYSCTTPDLRYPTYQQYLGQIYPECNKEMTDDECTIALIRSGKMDLEITAPGFPVFYLAKSGKTSGECAGLSVEQCYIEVRSERIKWGSMSKGFYPQYSDEYQYYRMPSNPSNF